MTTAAKLAIAAVIVAALAAVVGYDLLHGKPKPADGATEPAKSDGGFSIFQDNASRQNPGEAIQAAEQREAGAVNAPVIENDRTPPPPPAVTLPVEPPPSNEEYVVQSGDLLSDIAERKYGDPNKWTLIAKANPGINPSKLKIGTKLVLPSEAAPVPAAATPADSAVASAPSSSRPKTYTIQAGDALSKIAKKFYGTTAMASKIQQANAEALKDADYLTVGTTIVLPDAPDRAPVTVTSGEPGTVQTTAHVDPAVATGRSHTVARGDSLWKIAEKHHGGQGVLAYMDKLVAANPDKLSSKNTPLRAGWVLAIPNPE